MWDSSYAIVFMPSVLWRCWLGGRKGIQPVKKLERWGTGIVICLEQGADLHTAKRMPLLLLTVSCFSKIQFGFTFLVPAHPCSPGQRAFKRVCACARAHVCVCVCPGIFRPACHWLLFCATETHELWYLLTYRNYLLTYENFCLQCFETVSWASGRASSR